MSKAIKKISTILLIVVASVVALLLLCSVLLNTSLARATAADALQNALLEKTGLRLKIASFDVGFASPIELKDIALADSTGQTLATCAEATVSLSLRSLWRQKPVVHSLRLSQLVVSLALTPDGIPNIDFSLPEKNDESVDDDSELNIEIDEVIFSKSAFTLFSAEGRKNIDLGSIEAKINNIILDKNIISAQLPSLSFADFVSLRFAQASGNFLFCNNQLTVTSLDAEYGLSIAKADSLNFDFSANAKTPLRFDNIDATLASSEARLFWSEAPEELNLNLKTSVSVDDNDLNIKSLVVSAGEETTLTAQGSFYDFSDSLRCYFNGRILKAESSAASLAQFLGVEADEEALQNIGSLRFSAAIDGPVDDVKIEAKLRTGIGNAAVDARAVLSNRGSKFSGRLFADNLYLAHFTKNIVGSANISANYDIELAASGKFKNFGVTAVSQNVEVNGYRYQSVTARCRTNGSHIVAAMEVCDPAAHVVVGAGADVDAENKYYALVTIDSLLTDTTNLTPYFPVGKLSASLDVKLDANSLDDANACARISNITFTDGVRKAHADSLIIDARLTDDDRRRIDVRSDLVNGAIAGRFLYADVVNELRNQLAAASHSLCDSARLASPETILGFNLEYQNVEQFLQFFASDINLGDKGLASGHLRASDHNSHLQLKIGDVAYGDVALQNLVADFVLAGDSAVSTVTTDLLSLPILGDIGRVSFNTALRNDSLTLRMRWQDIVNHRYAGSFASLTAFGRDELDNLYSTTLISPTTYMLNNDLWQQSEALVHISKQEAVVSGFSVTHEGKFIGIEGSTVDTLNVLFQNLEIGEMFRETPHSNFALAGKLTSQIKISDTFGEMSASFAGGIDDFYVNHDWLDHLDISAVWQPQAQRIDLLTSIVTLGCERARGIGRYELPTNYFDIMFDVDSVSIGFLNFYLGGAVRDIAGTSCGWLRLHGPLSSIEMDAHLGVNRTDFAIKQTGVDYTFVGGDTIVISPKSVDFCNLRFVDRYGKQGVFSGNILHDMFSGLQLNISFLMPDQLVFNLSEKESPTYYGTIFANGLLKVTGTIAQPHLDIDAYSCEGTDLYILPLQKSELGQTSYIKFRTPANVGVPLDKYEIEDLLSSVTAHMTLDLRPNAQIHIVVDPKTDNRMSVRGNAILGIDIDRAGDLLIQGQYEVEEGTYNLAINLLKNKFVINKGSLISWDDGNPYNALLDMSATYKVKASLYDLVSGIEDFPTSDIKRRVPINCNLLLSGRMFDPNIKFKIEIPSTSNFSQYAFDQYVTTEEEMNRQAISLLLTNQFYPLQTTGNHQQGSVNFGGRATELITNQLSNFISKNKYNIGIGLNYRPGDEVSNEEYEVSFSTQFFDNKMLVSGNVGYGRDVQNASGNGQLIGDFDVEMKLNQRGNLRAKAYTHSNNDVIYEQSPTTQGVGISFSDEFDNFGELMRRYWYALSGQRRRDRKAASQHEKKNDEGEAKESPEVNEE